MEFSIKAGSSENTQTGCIVVGVFEPRKLSDAAAALDRATKGFLTRILKRGDMEGKTGTTLLLHDVPNVKAERVLLVQGTGFNWPKPDHFRLVFLPHEDDLRDAIARIARPDRPSA